MKMFTVYYGKDRYGKDKLVHIYQDRKYVYLNMKGSRTLLRWLRTEEADKAFRDRKSKYFLNLLNFYGQTITSISKEVFFKNIYKPDKFS